MLKSNTIVATLRALAVVGSLLTQSFQAGAVETSDQAPAISSPSVRNIVTDGCPAGSALIGITVERYRGQAVALQPRCRPASQGAPNAWCDPSPPAGVSCSCDGFEQLQWQRMSQGGVPGCWACVGNGQACAPQPGCSCLSTPEGAWVPMLCQQTAATATPSSLRQSFDASQSHCVRVQSTGCTYRSVPGRSC